MKGNYQSYLFGEIYELEPEEAMPLVVLGYADKVEIELVNNSEVM